MIVEIVLWASVRAFFLLCLLLTLESAELLSPRAWLHGLRSKARKSRGGHAILLWSAFAFLYLVEFLIFMAAMPAALGMFGHIVAAFIAAMLIGGLARLVIERIALRFLSRMTER